MKNFQKKKNLGSLLQSKVFLAILGIVIMVFFASIWGFWGKMQETAQNKKNLEEKIYNLEKSRQKLENDIVKLQTDKGIDENIREKFGLGKEGEEVITIIEDKDTKALQSEVPSGFFSFIKDWFD